MIYCFRLKIDSLHLTSTFLPILHSFLGSGLHMLSPSAEIAVGLPLNMHPSFQLFYVMNLGQTEKRIGFFEV